MSDSQYSVICGHCGGQFWSYNFSPTRVCNDCFSHGHRGNGGDCWKCKATDTAVDEDHYEEKLFAERAKPCVSGRRL